MVTKEELTDEATLQEVWDTFTEAQQLTITELVGRQVMYIPIKNELVKFRQTLSGLQLDVLNFFIAASSTEGRHRR